MRALAKSDIYYIEVLGKSLDILDSFALARELKKGNPLPAYLDVNGDGVVNEQDVNSIASRAVALGKDNRP